MHIYMVKKLDCDYAKPTRMNIILVDYSFIYPYDVLNDVLVKVNSFLFTANFFILDIDEDYEVHLLLRRYFLSIIYLLYVEFGELMLRFQDEQLIINMFEVTCHHDENTQCYHVDVVEDVVEEVYYNESPLLHIERGIMSSIDRIDEGQDREVEECLYHL